MPSIFLVEDHHIVGQAISRFLREDGALDICAIVRTAEEALERLSQMQDDHQPVDLILIDVSLPGMSGIELLTVLRDLYPDLPCLMLSGHREEQYVQRCLEAGGRGYVSKGDPAAIREGVQRVLDGQIYVSKGLRGNNPSA